MPKTIELLLTENVDNLGIVGDVVKVKPGYARNFLLPRALATSPTKGAIARLAERRKVVEAEMEVQRADRQELIKKLEGHEVTVMRSANEQGVLFGGVSQHDIAEALRAEGYVVDDRAIRIGETIKRLDSYTIPIVLASDLKTQIKLWVVSDKPTEQLEAEAPVKEEAAATVPAPGAGTDAEESAKPKPKGKSKKGKADEDKKAEPKGEGKAESKGE